MLSILITVAIIAITAVMALQSMQQATRAFTPVGGAADPKRPGFNSAVIISQLRGIHQMELVYYQRFGRYASFEELVEDGSIAKGYAASEDEGGVAFIRYYDITIQPGGETFLLLAYPNSAAAAEWPDEELPAYRMDQTGEVALEEGWEAPSDADYEEHYEDADIFGALGDESNPDSLPPPEDPPPANE